MNSEDAEQLTRYLAARLREMGEPELADQDRYVFDDPERGRRRYDPHKRLTLMLDALEQTMALEDGNTFEVARRSIAEATEGELPVEVRVLPMGQEGASLQPSFSLSDLPDLRDLRDRLDRLAALIAQDDRGSGDLA